LRLALLADIHGNQPALEAVLEALKHDAPDGILVAGDWISGPWDNKVLSTLEEYADASVLGNTDIRLLEYLDGKTPEIWSRLKQFELLRWNARHINAHCLELLRRMPEQRLVNFDGTSPIRVVHGSLENPFEGLSNNRKVERLDRTFAELQEDVLLCGHTHYPMVVERDGKLIVNPGSVAAPLNGDTHAQYALLEWSDKRWQAELKRVAYDHQPVIQKFRESGMLAECGVFGRIFLETILSGEDITLLFFNHIDYLATMRGIELDSYLPDEIWEEADRSFDWKAIQKRRHD